MHNKNILLFIIYYFQVIYALNVEETILYTYNNITSYDKKYSYIYTFTNSISKDELLNITDSGFYQSHFCKNDICVKTDNQYEKPFIEIPDKNGNVHLYISRTFLYKDIKLKIPLDGRCSNDACISYKCNNDSECLYNKCIDNLCAFNDEAPVVHCDNIYLGHRKSYMYCGKAYGDTCNNEDECSSKFCKENICGLQVLGPSEGEGINELATTFYSLLIIIIIFLICICCCCCHCRKKRLINRK